jgi:hypothetical protein
MVDIIEQTRTPSPVVAPREISVVGGRVLQLARDLPLVPLTILVPFILIAIFANFIAPYDPTEPIPGAKIFEPPFWMAGGSTHTLLGTDFQSRDVLSRLIFGARVSLIIGVTGTIVAGSLGTALGILSGYLGGWIDQVIMRITDAWLALPALVFAIFLATVVGPQHVEYRHYPRAGLLDPLHPCYPRRGAEPARARVRQARRDRWRLADADHPSPHPAQCDELGNGAGEPDDRRRHYRRGVFELSRDWRPGAAAGLAVGLPRSPSLVRT